MPTTGRRRSRATSNSFFRERDRAAMLDFFDLWSFDDVRANVDAILAAVRAGSMPCDMPWSNEKVDLLERWLDSGTPRERDDRPPARVSDAIIGLDGRKRGSWAGATDT